MFDTRNFYCSSRCFSGAL